MFTGIVDHFGTITQLEHQPNKLTISIQSQFEDLIEGESIAVNGVCLTILKPARGLFSCQLSPETLNLTNARNFSVGHPVNLERSLCLGDRMGGHWVTGHIDQTVPIRHIETIDEFLRADIASLSPDHMRYIIKKGSVALNGVSLTINEIFDDGFQVMLIPHTLERTNLGLLKIGDLVNLEFDWMTRVIVQQYQQHPCINHD